MVVRYGSAGDIPLAGDGDGDSRDTLGVVDPAGHVLTTDDPAAATTRPSGSR